jgi:hypothetical protein
MPVEIKKQRVDRGIASVGDLPSSICLCQQALDSRLELMRGKNLILTRQSAVYSGFLNQHQAPTERGQLS